MNEPFSLTHRKGHAFKCQRNKNKIKDHTKKLRPNISNTPLSVYIYKILVWLKYQIVFINRAIIYNLLWNNFNQPRIFYNKIVWKQ